MSKSKYVCIRLFLKYLKYYSFLMIYIVRKTFTSYQLLILKLELIISINEIEKYKIIFLKTYIIYIRINNLNN